MKILSVKRNAKSLVSVMLVLVLLFGSFASFAVEDNQKLKVNSAREDLKSIADAKIQKEVKDELEKSDYVEVLVQFKDKVNPEKIVQLNSTGKTPYQQKLSGRKALVNALQDKAEISQRRLVQYLKQEQLKSNKVEFESFYIVNMVYVKGPKELVEKISYMNEVDKIYLNKKVYLDETKKSTSKANISSTEGLEWNIERVQADKAWNLGYDGTGVVVGIIDTGGEWTHPAIQAKWRGYNPEDPENPINVEENWFDGSGQNGELPYDDNSHATHCLGTILGQEPDGKNKIGVAPGAKWIAAKAFTSDGGASNKSLISCGQWMLAPGGNTEAAPDVINNSWGGGDGIDDWYRDMVRAWRAADILPVFAAGNQGLGEPAPWPGSIECPSNYPESFAVAATDIDNKRGSFSKLGPSPYDESLIKPEISAPGVDVRSSVPGGKYELMDGTSMATPHIVGVTALMLSANQSLGVDDITSIIEDTATPLTDGTYRESPNCGYGYGLVNAFEAVSFVGEGIGAISGQVLVDGEDVEQPKLGHEQTITEAFMDSDIEIRANASDDVSITSAEILVKFEGEDDFQSIKMSKALGDHKDGTYEGYISKSILKEGKLTYKIKARDFAGNEIETREHFIDIKFGVVPDEYEENFESEPMGWNLSGDWEWGPYGNGYQEPKPFGEKYVGTVLGGYYNESSESVLVTPPIDLRDATLEAATLKYKQWYKMASWSTFAKVFVSKDDGENWEQIGDRFTGDGSTWQETSINLKDYIGSEKPVYVAFSIESGLWGNDLGWYIDDVKFEGPDVTAPIPPSNLKATPRVEGIKLDWAKSPDGDVDVYNIYRSEVSGEGYTKIGSTSDITFTDEDVEVGKTYYYVVNATDFCKNEGEYSDEAAATPLVFNTIYYSNFEDNNGNLLTGGDNNSWEWGVPTYGPEGPLTGTNVWATNLSGDYKNDSNCWLKLENVELPSEGNLILNIWHWFDTEGIKWDYGQIQVSTDKENWTNIEGARFGDHTKEWLNKEISLNEYKGQTVSIRFLFVSDSMNFGSNTFMGWYIDSIGIYNIDDPNYIVSKNVSENYEVQNKEEIFVPSEELNHVMNNKLELNTLITPENSVTAIPVDAVVTVLETGRSVKTDLATGEFFLRHAANKEGQQWTLRAEAYGYYPKEAKVYLEEGKNVIEDFHLDPIPTTSISGKVFDRYSKKPVANATVRLKEDSHVPSVTTDENGNFVMPKVYEGKYTLKVNHDDFEPGEVTIEAKIDGENDFEAPLKRFVDYPEEIVYDDGTAENAVAFDYKDYGFAIRVTPAQYGKVKGARIYFWDESYPIPGGNETSVTIIEADANGNPKGRIGEPKVANIKRGAWNYIDLSDFNYKTDKDFFVAIVQTQSDSPGVGVDNDSKESDRSYIFGKGQFMQLSEADLEGGLMIRTVMSYSMDNPQITNLQEVNYTNQFNINVEGSVTSDCKIKVFVNDEEQEIVDTENKVFSTNVRLTQDINTIYVKATLDGKETEPSETVTVIKDQTLPELTVSSPEDRINVNDKVIDVIGNTKDMYFDKVTVNDELVEVDEDGNFVKPIILNDGENVIVITAYDLAGNQTVVKRRVYLNDENPVITDIKPETDLIVEAGDEVEISFRSEVTGGDARYRIVYPYGINTERMGVSMEEVEPGYYKATWTVPEGISLNNAAVEFELTDTFGNVSYATALGRVTVGQVLPDTQPMENLPMNTVIVGNEAYDIRFLNSNAQAQTKLIEWFNGKNPVYIKLNDTTIVNINGEEVEIEVLPSELTYYDEFGKATVYKK